MAAAEGDRPRVTLLAGPFVEQDLQFVSMKGREALSRLFSFEVTALTRAEPASLPRLLLGQPAALMLEVPGGEPRSISGIVAEVTPGAASGPERAARVTLRLVPRMWLLRRTRNSRIFQDRTVSQIVTTVLADLRIPCSFRLARPERAKTYCVQYDETDHEFVTRLLAEEGIFFYFEHGPPPDPSLPAHSTEMAVFCDGHTYPPLGGVGDEAAAPVLPLRPPEGLAPAGEAVHELTAQRRVRTKSVLLKDFDFTRPNLDVTSRAAVPAPDDDNDLPEAAARGVDPASLRVYEPSGDYDEPDLREDRAERALRQIRRRALVARGESGARRFEAGRRFTLSEHPIETLNREYVLIRVDHEAHAPEHARPSAGAGEAPPVYRNTFECGPAEEAYPPRRRRREPRQVLETAMVVGPANEEIYTDRLGRIKVQFHWDRNGARNEHSSCWVRASQAWAGASWGFQFIPRVGMEVLVSFLGGDTDRPVVLGCLYNPLNPPPYDLPRDAAKSGVRTRSTPGSDGYNELSFDDRKGNELVSLHAQRDLSEVVENDHTVTVGRFDDTFPSGDQKVNVGRDQRVEVGGEQRVIVKGRQELELRGGKNEVVEVGAWTEVRGPRVDRSDKSLSQEIGTTHHYEAHGDLEHKVGGKAHYTVGGDSETKVHGDVKTTALGSVASSTIRDHAIGAVQDISLTSAESVRLVCGDSMIELRQREIVISSPTITIAATGTAAMIAEGASLHLEAKKAKLAALEEASVLADEVKLYGKQSEALLDAEGVSLFSQGASVVLDQDAHVDGMFVKLNCGGKSGDFKEAEPDELLMSWVDVELYRPMPKPGDPTQVEEQPVPGARYVVEASDGRLFHGVLDGNGRARVLVPPGSVHITFPDNDEGRVKPK